MKSWIILLLLGLLILVGCMPVPDHAELEAGCIAPGEIISSEIENVSRGYPYRYMVYLPPCYDATAKPGYPVIYLVPGRGGGVGDWFGVGVNEIADQLILADEVPPFILVTTETTNSDPFATEIYNDLIPQIEENFNALTDRLHRVVAGGSLGGIAAYRLTFQYPDEFASAGMFGSGVVNGENEQVATWLSSTIDENRPRVFINVGEQDPLMLAQAQVMTEILDQAGVPYEFIVGEGTHTYGYWSSNMEQYFRWVAQDW